LRRVSTATLDWFGCATFRLRTAEGLTVMLDAYLDRVPEAAQSGMGVADVAADLGPRDWILVGHSHFDHLYGAERLAATGARIVGSYESVRIMAACGLPEEQLVPVSGGERVRLDDTTTVRVLPGLHSCVWSRVPFPASDQECLGELGGTWQEHQEQLRAMFAGLTDLGPDVAAHLQAASQGERGDGGALVFVVETSEGSLLVQDTAGAWSGLLAAESPDVAILAAAGRANRDGEPVQGSLAGFVAEEAGRLRPRRLVLSHHDAWLPGFAGAVDVGPIREAVARSAPDTEFCDLGYASGFPLFA
jgi:L-ascorbate metabolism protein UlaG (beta-lactamase superfamily)